jgi:hypothetical protein
MKTVLCIECAIRPDDEKILTALAQGNFGSEGPRSTVIGIRNGRGEIYRLVECANLGEFMKITGELDRCGLVEEPFDHRNACDRFQTVFH